MEDLVSIAFQSKELRGDHSIEKKVQECLTEFEKKRDRSKARKNLANWLFQHHSFLDRGLFQMEAGPSKFATTICCMTGKDRPRQQH
jgi:hypothetical protein